VNTQYDPRRMYWKSVLLLKVHVLKSRNIFGKNIVFSRNITLIYNLVEYILSHLFSKITYNNKLQGRNLYHHHSVRSHVCSGVGVGVAAQNQKRKEKKKRNKKRNENEK
jgi:hypothetical protein